MNDLEKLIPLFAVPVSFAIGFVCINHPFAVARLIAQWFKFVSGGSLEKYKANDSRVKEVFELINQPSAYLERFPGQIQIIRQTGCIALLVAVVGTCIILLSGL